MTVAVPPGSSPQLGIALQKLHARADVFAPPPFFDPVALRNELSGYAMEHDDAQQRRQVILERLKELVRQSRETAQARLEVDGDGRRCASGLSMFQDELIRLLYAHALAHVHRATNPADAERMAIVATGGYGRGLLAPGSDVDLLFVLPYKQTPWGENVAEFILYMLWDLGLKVGHATRTIDQCVRLARTDSTIRTALLDSRLIDGDTALYDEFARCMTADVTRGSSRQYIDAKLGERDERHRRSGESRYRVEPNIKDGKGGLRDLHTLHWLAKYLYGADLGSPNGGGAEIFTSAELATFRRCEDFLWSVRCHLHFLTGRAEERLSFDVQRAMADRLGYRSAGGALPVERFMKHYFLVAKDVGDLTNILCSALEMQQLISAPRINRLLNPLTWTTRRRVRRLTNFRIDNERLNVGDQGVFERDPVNLVRIFAVAEETGTFLHPTALRLLRSSLRMINDKLRANPEANRIFLSLLACPTAETLLRHMNEAGVLGRFVPEFGQVVAMMQFNMYHHYTVDEHLIRTIGQLRGMEDGQFADILPVSTEIFPSIENRRALYVAAFLHDIGKGRAENHSVVGARIARELGPRLGMSGAETATAAWLIEEHLTMSNIAQSRDMSDPKTIRDFATIVQSPERLKLLLLLTVADIRAVGPGTWNGWKGQLLRQLYWETEPLVAGGHTLVSRRERIAVAQQALKAELADWPEEEVDNFIERHYDDYWLKAETRKLADHARLFKRAEAGRLKLATVFTSDAFTAITELTVMAPNHPRLLALFAGCCLAAGANIIGAHISTTRDGLALDTFLLQREFEEDADETRRVNRIASTIENVLKGEIRLAKLMAARKPQERRIIAFSVEPEVVINNALSDHFTVVEATGLDRPGLLYDLTSTMSDLSLDITSAHITTYGEKAVDVFYVTDLTGKKVTADVRQKAIRRRLVEVLKEAAPQ